MFLGIVLAFSLLSLATGTPSDTVSESVHTAVSLVSHPFWKGLDTVGDGVDYVSGLLFSYHSAQSEARRLRHELYERLPQHAEVLEIRAENQRLREMLAFQREHPGLAMLPAEVVPLPAEVMSKSRGMLVLDRGSLHGVKEFMCVLTYDGVVGVVTRVEPTLCQVATLHHEDCKIGAMIVRNRVRGVVHGSGNLLTHICSMHYIDLKDEVRKGDQVVTCGGTVYPAGFPIGVVAATYEEGALQRTAELEPAADPYSADEVFIVLGAQLSAREMAASEPLGSPPSPAHAMPDDRPIPERYAP